LDTEEYNRYLGHYISSLYFTGRVDEYKNIYSDNIENMANSSQSILPLADLAYNPGATETDLQWAVELSDRLLVYTDHPFIEMAIRRMRSAIYERLGKYNESYLERRKAEEIEEMLKETLKTAQ
jgi:hypothetical protein